MDISFLQNIEMRMWKVNITILNIRDNGKKN